MLRFFTLHHVAFLIVFAVLGTVTAIHDPDFYFHLVAGQYILEHRTLPHVDVFSFTMAGEPWHMHEWLFEVAVALLYRLGGEPLIVWSNAALGLGAVYLLFRVGRNREGGSLFSLLPVLLALLFYLPYVTQRPQVVTFFSLALYLAALLRLKYAGERRWLWLLPPLMVVWVNSHGGYLLGIALLAGFLFSEAWLWWRAGRPPLPGQRLRALAVTLSAVVLASLANPYFIAHWWFPFELMGRDAMGVISEWQRPDFSAPFFQGYLVCLLLFLVHYLALRRRPDLTEWLLPAAVVAASLIAARHVPLAALTLLPFALHTLGRPSRFAPLLSRVRGGRELGGREPWLNLLLLCVALGMLTVLSPALQARQQQLKRSILPVEAVTFIEQQGIGGRLFNQYRYGGYLLHRLYPQQRVFIDIRADMYGDAMMRDYTAMFFGARGWEKVFDRYRFDAVLCERDAVLVALLLERGDFRQVYADAHNVVLQRKE